MLLEAVEKQRKKYENKKAKDIAKNMIKEGLAVDLISEVTGLSIKEVEKLAK